MTIYDKSHDSSNYKNVEKNKTKVYLGKEFELCEKCRQITFGGGNNYDYSTVFGNCQTCKLKLSNDATVEEVFYLMRIWKPEMQKKMDLLIDLVGFDF